MKCTWRSSQSNDSSLSHTLQHDRYETCEYSKCWNTVDREELSQADAVWFYCANLPEENDVYPEPWNDTTFPKRVYSCLESPIYTANSKKRLEPSHRVFDWTMTLNRDSTIEPSWYVVFEREAREYLFFFFTYSENSLVSRTQPISLIRVTLLCPSLATVLLTHITKEANRTQHKHTGTTPQHFQVVV